MHRVCSILPTLLWLCTNSVNAEFYSTYTGEQISPLKYAQYQALGLVPYCAQEIKTCDEKEPRRDDYSCNNLHRPIRGTITTPYRRMIAPVYGGNYDFRPQTTGMPLPNARSVRTSVYSDGRLASKEFTTQLMSGMPLSNARSVRTSVYSDGRLASKEFTTQLMSGLLGVTLDSSSIHDIFNYVLLTQTCCVTGYADPRCIPIYVPDDDIHLRYSTTRCLNLTRHITYQDLGCAPMSLPPERVNLNPPMLELSIIYGQGERARRAREYRGGRLRVDNETRNGKEWPPSGSYLCVGNQAQLGETRCSDSPDTATNILIAPNVQSIWFYRNHNRIARQLEAINPCWNDEQIFIVAKEINIATANQIWYYEMFPLLLGHEYLLDREIIYDTLGHVNDYNPKLEPRVSIDYIVATRWFHNMQEGRLNKYSRKGKLLEELNYVDYNLRTGGLPLNNTIEGITQGFFRQGTAKNDYVIDPEIGERIFGNLQTVSDIASIDLQRVRDSALPPYVEYRKHCHLPVPKKFDDLLEWMPQEKVDALRFRYDSVEDIELYPAILSEKYLDGPVPPTLKCIMADQLWWWRKADRFWYENNQHPYAFTPEQLYEIRKSTMSRLVCDNGDDVREIQPNMFLLPGHGNEITKCSNLPKIDLEKWKDCPIHEEPQILVPKPIKGEDLTTEPMPADIPEIHNLPVGMPMKEQTLPVAVPMEKQTLPMGKSTLPVEISKPSIWESWGL